MSLARIEAEIKVLGILFILLVLFALVDQCETSAKSGLQVLVFVLTAFGLLELRILFCFPQTVHNVLLISVCIYDWYKSRKSISMNFGSVMNILVLLVIMTVLREALIMNCNQSLPLFV